MNLSTILLLSDAVAIHSDIVLQVGPETIARPVVQMHLASDDRKAWSPQRNAAFADAFVQE